MPPPFYGQALLRPTEHVADRIAFLQEQVRPVWGVLVAAAAPCCQWYLPAYTWGLPHTLAS